MNLDISPLENAFSQLERSLSYFKSEAAQKDEGLREQFRAAVIQCFEYTYELAIKMMRRQLEQISANPRELKEMPFMDLIRTAAEAGLVEDVQAFRIYREKRNITSHTYESSVANDVVSVTDRFCKDVKFLIKCLRLRNQR